MFLSWTQRLNISRYEPKKTLRTKRSNEKKQNKECIIIGLTMDVDDSMMFLAKINKSTWPHVFTLKNITHLSNLKHYVICEHEGLDDYNIVHEFFCWI
jgi:hypothetical protein